MIPLINSINVLVACCLTGWLATCTGIPLGSQGLGSSRCSYQSCPHGNPDMINVHIVAHTHNDVGWLKTVDQYFYGSRNDIARAGVQYILDSVVNELLHDPTKKFTYVETAFFWRWWSEQSDYTRHQVQKLVRNGQLEFIGGGWCQNDEATTHYNAVIDQMTWGLRRLTDSFGKCGVPRVIWQIDPFGHAKEQASLFAQMYFDALFLGRIDYQDKATRENTTNMEFMWEGSNNLGKAANLFTGILPNTYSPPSGFCFDLLCDDPPIMDDPRLMDYNVNERVNEFLDIVKDQARNYATNNLIITMGNDFNYQSAGSWFRNLDKLIKHVNARQASGGKVQMFYSTPSCYAYSLNKANKTWSTKSDDFMPYASDPHAFWTGYYTSRPALKGYVRQTNNFLQVCKQLDTLTRLGPMDNTDVTTLREALAVAQHHDAVAGTEKQAVAYDYAQRLAKGVALCQDTVNDAYKKLMKTGSQDPPTQVFCNLLNISQCHITEGNSPVAVTVYNPIARPVSSYLRLPVTGKAYKVTGPNSTVVEAQIVPIPKAIIDIPGRKSNATVELVFKADIPPLGYATYFLKKTTNPHIIEEQKSMTFVPVGRTSIQNEFIAAILNSETGFLDSIHWVHGPSVDVNQSFYWYRGMAGNNSKTEARASGAYIFRPNGTTPNRISENAKVTVIKGNLVEEFHQTFNPWVSQVIRIYKGTDNVELDWLVGPIPVADGVGKEIISRFDSQLKTNGIFYTDANGREMQKRVRNYRPTWKLELDEPISGNYYPVNSRIYMQDESQNTRFTVLTDRSQGGSSIEDGSLELMVHRRLLYDDAFGVGEPLDEPGFNGTGGLIVRGTHYIQITRCNDASAAKHRELAEKIYMGPWVSFAQYNGSEIDWIKTFRAKFSGVNNPLPPNVHLLTLEQWKGNSILLRLEHFYEKTEDPSHLSKPAVVSLKGLFTPFKIRNVLETTLGANQLLKTAHRLQWKTTEGEATETDLSQAISDDFEITLNPMQIRTFIVLTEEKSVAIELLY